MQERFNNPSLLYRIEDELLNNRLGSFIYKNYIDSLGLKGDERVLDFGSGSGAGSKHLARLLSNGGGKLTCVDTSEFLTQKAKTRMKRFNNVDYKVGMLQELSIPTASHDIIYIHYVLHDVEVEFRHGILHELHRIMKDNGKLFIAEPHKRNHGMPVIEIGDLMRTAGFKEFAFSDTKTVYKGTYVKIIV